MASSSSAITSKLEQMIASIILPAGPAFSNCPKWKYAVSLMVGSAISSSTRMWKFF